LPFTASIAKNVPTTIEPDIQEKLLKNKPFLMEQVTAKRLGTRELFTKVNSVQGSEQKKNRGGRR
jgi:hypothetical protein